MRHKDLFTSLTVGAALVLPGCLDVETPEAPNNEQEVITTVSLAFAPQGGGATAEAAHADPENDGAPVVDPITLVADTTYTLTVRFINELEDPPEDLSVEVEEEAEEHQVLISGSAVEGPATPTNPEHIVTHSYTDEDDNGFPVGLASAITAVRAGSGELRVMLRHLPLEGGAAVKDENTARDFANGGSAGIPGDADADVTFPLTVQ